MNRPQRTQKIAGILLLSVMIASATPSDQIIHLWVVPRPQDATVPDRPDWIPAEAWEHTRLDQLVQHTGSADGVSVLACGTQAARHIRLFIYNQREETITLKIHPPDPAWKWTGHGEWISKKRNSQTGTWEMTPSMPLPLPREFTAHPQRLIYVNLNNMNP